MRFLPLTGMMALIFLLSHTSGKDMPQGIDDLDKVCHALAYGALAASALWAWLPQITYRGTPALWGIFFFCLLYGISDEFHQSFIPGRYPSFADIVADGVGAGLFLLAWWLWQRQTTQTKSQ